VIGMGNVAVDVARILCLPPRQLAETDMADEAIEALSKSQVREVYMLGRRGVVQAAFTTVEVKELGELEDADVIVDADECALDPASAQELAAGRPTLKTKVDIVQGFTQKTPAGKQRRLHIRFCVSPLEILGDDRGRVRGLKIARNRLVKDDTGIRAEPTGEVVELEVGLVFRSVGYKGVRFRAPLRRAPRHAAPREGKGVRPGDRIAVTRPLCERLDQARPSGVIGNNKARFGRDREHAGRRRESRSAGKPFIARSRGLRSAPPRAPAAPRHLRRLARARPSRSGGRRAAGPAAGEVHDHRGHARRDPAGLRHRATAGP
jgi:ferredoxin--NADP+ reductase